MNTPRRILLPALIVALGGLALAPAGAAEEATVPQDPAARARLKQQYLAFRQLAPDRQERIRKLDRDLQDETPGMRDRLVRVAQRYADWLDQLSEADREAVERASDRKAKLRVIREIRERQWIARLPKAKRDQIQQTAAPDRARLVRQAWEEEWDQRADWLVVRRHGDVSVRNPERLPTSLDRLPREVRDHVQHNLKPLLNDVAEKRLADAEGKWPRYARVLVELADDHPMSVLGPIGPTRVKDLVPEGTEPFKKLPMVTKGARERLQKVEGKWPEFGVELRMVTRPFGGRPVLDPRLTPDRPTEFPQVVQQFLEKRLLPALEPSERAALKAKEGQWPAYQRQVMRLAREHNLVVPTETPLPGPADGWDRYRMRFTGVADGPRP
jgi:hypothetical protein